MTKHGNKDDRRSQILNAAIECFSQRGYSTATTKDIARIAGISEGAIFRHFPTKKDILYAIMVHFTDVMAEALKPIQELLANTQDRDIRCVLRDVMLDRMNTVNKLYPLARIAVSEILYYEDIRQLLFRKMILPLITSYSAFHYKMVERGLMRADIPPTAVVRSIFANIMAFIAQHKLFPVKQTKEEMEKEFEAVMELIIDGIAPKNVERN